MRIKSIIALVFCFCVVTLRAQYKMDSDLLNKYTTKFKVDFKSISNAKKPLIEKINNEIDSTNISLKLAKPKDLYNEIRKRDSLERELKFIKINERYEFGLKAINEMEKGVVLITFMQNILQLQQEINNITNLWSDNDIRNNYDKLTDVLTVAGPMIAGGMLATDNGNSKDEKIVIGASISLIAVSQIIKKIFGNETTKKYEFIDMTRRSYDHLVILNQKLKQYISDNSTLELRLNKFKSEYEKNKSTLFKDSMNYQNASKDLMTVIGFMDEYQIVLSQIPLYIYELKGLLLTFSFKKYNNNTQYLQTINLLKDKVSKIELTYMKKVKPLLEVAPEFKTYIYGVY